jgi:hypothetical protein
LLEIRNPRSHLPRQSSRFHAARLAGLRLLLLLLLLLLLASKAGRFVADESRGRKSITGVLEHYMDEKL